MMLCKNILELVRKLSRLLGVAIGDVGDEVDQVVERLNEAGARIRRCQQEQLTL